MLRFPEEVYQPGPDTRLYKFIQSLCGDAGAGILKAQSLAIRLKNEGPLLVFNDLDTFYAHIFSFPRIRRELYNYDSASNSLLDVTYDPTNVAVEKEVWDKINAADDSYRRRVVDFMQATRNGNSPTGMQLAAKAGSGEPCEVVENYRYVFDQLSDDPLLLEHTGDTFGTGEFTIQPAGIDNAKNNANTVTLTFVGSPSSGTFKLKYQTAVTSAITWDGTNISVAIYNALIGLSSGTLMGNDDVTVTADPSDIHIYTIVLNDRLLDALFLGVENNSLNTGKPVFSYPLGDSYYMADFQYPLASFQEDNYGEITSGNYDTDHPTTDLAFGADNVALGPTIRLLPDIEYNMVRTVEHLKPVGAVMTVKPKRSSQIAVQAAGVFASSENFNLIRWVSGNPAVKWPPLDASEGAFIQGIATSNGVTKNVENEATTFAWGTHVFPSLFQTVQDIKAYTEDALEDPFYNTPSFFSDRYLVYKSEHTGSFDHWVTLMFPFLQSVAADDNFSIGLAVPGEPAPVIINYPFITA